MTNFFKTFFISAIITGLLFSFVYYFSKFFIPQKSSIENLFGKVQILNQKDLGDNFQKPCFDKEPVYNTDLGNKKDLIGYQNNKFGLYIYAELDHAEIAGDLVNSNGGEWGYVLIPYNVRDYDSGKWKKMFRAFKENKLIPIVQLWDLKTDDEDYQITQSVQFLNALPWPIKPRYISVYNEPNDDAFWKGKADPSDYARILDKTIDAFKDVNTDFFMLNGAFNASARGGEGYIDEEEFLIKMNEAVPGIFKKLDGWASHPYPQPNFSGSPSDFGRNSIRAYQWELELLSSLFEVRKIPVFITETGWAHSEGEDYDGTYLPVTIVGEYLIDAFKNVWLPDNNVVAVNLFTIKYDSPYDHFSLVDKEERPYPHFKMLQEVKKIAGKPPYLVEEGTICEKNTNDD